MDKKFNYKKINTVINVSRIVTIHYDEYGPNFVFQGESHNFWELVYVDKGKVQIRRDDEDMILEQGEIIFHRPNEFHSIRSLDSSPNFFVITFVCSSPVMQHFERYTTRLDKHLKVFVSSIIREANNTYHISKNDSTISHLPYKSDAPLGGEQLIKNYLEQLLIFLLRSITQKGDISIFPQKENETNPLVSAIKDYLAVRVEETVRIEDICHEFGYSRSFLSKQFQSQTGESLMSYATGLKIDRAKQLIRETKMNFAQISVLLAFENPQYFCRVFKRRTGMTPTEFKNRAHI